MTLDKYTHTSYFEIFAPRYHDNTVLLACHKVGTHNKVVFTKAPTMGIEPYYLSGKTIRRFKKESNGRLMCHAVPLEKLEPLDYSENSELIFK